MLGRARHNRPLWCLHLLLPCPWQQHSAQKGIWQEGCGGVLGREGEQAVTLRTLPTVMPGMDDDLTGMWSTFFCRFLHRQINTLSEGSNSSHCMLAHTKPPTCNINAACTSPGERRGGGGGGAAPWTIGGRRLTFGIQLRALLQSSC